MKRVIGMDWKVELLDVEIGIVEDFVDWVILRDRVGVDSMLRLLRGSEKFERVVIVDGVSLYKENESKLSDFIVIVCDDEDKLRGSGIEVIGFSSSYDFVDMFEIPVIKDAVVSVKKETVLTSDVMFDDCEFNIDGVSVEDFVSRIRYQRCRFLERVVE